MKSVGVSTPGAIILGPDENTDGIDTPANWTISCQSKNDHSLIDVMNRFVKDHPDLDWYGFLQDDLLFETPGWDTKLIAAAGRSGIASCDDSWRAPHRNTGASVYGGDLIRTWGFWGPPKLQHTYIDDFWEHCGLECKNWKVLMDVKTPHLHFGNGKKPKDATYLFSYAPTEADRREWHRYKNTQDYRDLLKRVKELVAAAA